MNGSIVRSIATALLVLAPLTASHAATPVRDGASALPAIAANDNTVAAGRLEKGVLRLDLVARRGLWHPDGPGTIGLPVEAFGEAGEPLREPGPLVRAPIGTRVVASVRNDLAHDLTVRGLASGSNALTTALLVRRGATRTVSFVLDRAGVFGYYGSAGETVDARIFEDTGLSGAIVADAPHERGVDHVFVLGLYAPVKTKHGAPDFRYFLETINGRSFPATERLAYTRGDTVRWGVYNASSMTHPMHLHGFYFKTAHADAYDEVTHAFHPGAAEEITWKADRAGDWMYHCHIGDHTSQHAALAVMRAGKGDPQLTIAQRYHQPDEGMAGMVVAVKILPRPGDRALAAREPARTLALDVGETGAHDKHFQLDEFTYALTDGTQTVAHQGSMGPPIVLTQGEPVAIAVTNHLRESTSVHWHGIALEDSYYDGGAGMAMGVAGTRMPPAIEPGKTFVAQFAPPDAGTFMYHSHLDDDWQTAAGLSGPLIVLPRGEKFDAATDHIEMLTESWESPGGLIAIDGSVSPAPLAMTAGLPQRLRFANLTLAGWDYVVSVSDGTHTTLWTPIAKDGRDIPARLQRPETSTHALTIGETRDFRFTPQQPGTYTLGVYDYASNNALVASQKIVVSAP